MSSAAEALADVDRMDAKAFASHLADDCLLRYANNDEVVGRDAIEAAIAGFFSTVKGISDDRPTRGDLHRVFVDLAPVYA